MVYIGNTVHTLKQIKILFGSWEPKQPMFTVFLDFFTEKIGSTGISSETTIPGISSETTAPCYLE